MAFEYKLVKQALKAFIQTTMGIPGGQIYTAPPKQTDITVYPAFIIRSATAVQRMVGEDGPTKVEYTLLLGIYTRAATSLAASDELDDHLKAFDTAVAATNIAGLPATGLTDSRWSDMGRLDQSTDFMDAYADTPGTVVYEARVAVVITEQTPYMVG